jgi:hypothetical protein
MQRSECTDETNWPGARYADYNTTLNLTVNKFHNQLMTLKSLVRRPEARTIWLLDGIILVAHMNEKINQGHKPGYCSRHRPMSRVLNTDRPEVTVLLLGFQTKTREPADHQEEGPRPGLI